MTLLDPWRFPGPDVVRAGAKLRAMDLRGTGEAWRPQDTDVEAHERQIEAYRAMSGPDRVAVSSSKSMHGHLLGAAGAVELVATLLAVRTGTIPPTLNLRIPDPECDLDYVPNVARRDQDIELAMTNSFAFGGTNAVLICRRA